jgi:hypothetical protein
MGQRLLLGRRRVIAATGAGRVAGFAGAVFEVGGHGFSPNRKPLIYLSPDLRSFPERIGCGAAFDGVECPILSWVWSMKNPVHPCLEKALGFLFCSMQGVYGIFRGI